MAGLSYCRSFDPILGHCARRRCRIAACSSLLSHPRLTAGLGPEWGRGKRPSLRAGLVRRDAGKRDYQALAAPFWPRSYRVFRPGSPGLLKPSIPPLDALNKWASALSP